MRGEDCRQAGSWVVTEQHFLLPLLEMKWMISVTQKAILCVVMKIKPCAPLLELKAATSELFPPI